jgi:hypothetical protein
MNIYAEVLNDYMDDEEVIHIDAYKTSGENETGQVIAYVTRTHTITSHPNALICDTAIAAIKDAEEQMKSMRDRRSKFHEAITNLIQRDMITNSSKLLNSIVSYVPYHILEKLLDDTKDELKS